MISLDDALPRLAREPTADVDLATVALLLAKDEYPELGIAEMLRRVDDWADLLRQRIAGLTLAEQVEQLSDLLFVELGFLGNTEHYYDPRNSYLHEVITRRCGIPITLTLVTLAVGRRAGLRIDGVALPGHFIAKAVAGAEFIMFDPFHGGRWLTPIDCEELSSRLIGVPFHFGPKDFTAATNQAFVSRMLNNLRAIYLKMEDFNRAGRVLLRMSQLLPDDLTLKRDQGLCHLRQAQPGLAVPLLQSYLHQEPLPSDAELAKEWLREARRELAKWN